MTFIDSGHCLQKVAFVSFVFFRCSCYCKINVCLFLKLSICVSVPGRFDETVIEERRQCAEDLLQFSANIPALYNSKQLEEFFKVG